MAATHFNVFARMSGADVIAMAKADRANVPCPGRCRPVMASGRASRSRPRPRSVRSWLRCVRFFVECGGVPGATATRMNSSEFKATLIEVRKISDDRTYEQLRIAQYWENLSGAYAAGAWTKSPETQSPHTGSVRRSLRACSRSRTWRASTGTSRATTRSTSTGCRARPRSIRGSGLRSAPPITFLSKQREVGIPTDRPFAPQGQ